jgi:hypothetical protein
VPAIGLENRQQQWKVSGRCIHMWLKLWLQGAPGCLHAMPSCG